MDELSTMFPVLILDLIMTAFLYMLLPVISYFTDKEGFTKKQLIQFVVLNSCVVCAIFWFFYIFTGTDRIPNLKASVFYAFINYYLLKKHIKEKPKDKEIREREIKENEELEDLINSLEKDNKRENKDE